MSPEIDESITYLIFVIAVTGVSSFCLLLMFFRFVYRLKQPAVWPAGRRTVCWFPKYQLSAELPVTGEASIEEQLTNRLSEHGFHLHRHEDTQFVFTRGSVLGEFSIKWVRLNIFVVAPVSNPVTLEIEYAAAFGTLLDTGDLWRLCREIKETIEDEPT